MNQTKTKTRRPGSLVWKRLRKSKTAMLGLIIIAIIVVFVIIGIRSSSKHFKGQGGCCGGSSPAPKKKKLSNVIARKTLIIEGMTCENCKNRVERCINDIDGAAASVNLRQKKAVVSLAKEISDEQLRGAVEKMGYKVVEIR